MAGPLKNARHERFAKGLFEGMSQIEAYTVAGYRPNDGHAARLAGNGRVKARVAELQGKAAAKVTKAVAIDAQWVLDRSRELYDLAVKEKQLGVAKGTVELIGKHVMVQAFKDRVEHSGTIEYKNLSDEEIAARIAAHEVARGDRPTAH
jgi:phage terminase small subunit